MIVPYKSYLKKIASDLRRNSTKSEVLLWQRLKNGQLGYDFHRQKPILDYIVDFYCPDLQLAIEVDGYTHEYKIGKDLGRQNRIEKLGIVVLRFSDEDILYNKESVLSSILVCISDNTSRHLRVTPSSRRDAYCPRSGDTLLKEDVCVSSPLERGGRLQADGVCYYPKKIFVFGNTDIPEDSLPIRLISQLQQKFPNIEFIHLDPNEEWGDVPEHFVMIDTVRGVDQVVVFDDLDKIQQTALVSLHDFDVAANLKWLKKLGKIKKLTIIGVPGGKKDVDVEESIKNILTNLRL